MLLAAPSRGVTRAEIAKQVVIVSLHFQLTTRTNKAVLSPALTRFDEEKEPTAYAAIVGWGDKHLLLDTSAAYANGIFMRLSMTFNGDLALQPLSRQLHQEEMRIFDMLDVEDDNGE